MGWTSVIRDDKAGILDDGGQFQKRAAPDHVNHLESVWQLLADLVTQFLLTFAAGQDGLQPRPALMDSSDQVRHSFHRPWATGACTRHNDIICGGQLQFWKLAESA